MGYYITSEDDFSHTLIGGAAQNITLNSKITLEQYTRILFLNYPGSNDGALLAIAPGDKIITAFRNNGVWEEKSSHFLATKSDLQSDWIPLKPYLVNSWEDNGASLYRKIGNCYLIKLSVRYGNYETDLDICRNLPFSGAGVCTNCFYNSSEVGNAIQVSGNRLSIVRTPIAKMDTIFANFIVGPNV